MALPVSHVSIALGLADVGTIRKRAVVCILCLLPDFDFALVLLGVSLHDAHRTASHSLLFAVFVAAAWSLWPRAAGWIGPRWVFLAVLSHAVYDMLCTADAADHGVMFFWPLSGERYGWPILVPLYRLVAETPFSWRGAIGFTLLEALLAWPFWRVSRSFSRLGSYRQESI